MLIRLPMTWRSRTSSPFTKSAAPEPTVRLICRSGATTLASCTASAASVSRSTVFRSSGRCWSSRASMSMSSTSTPIRADSCSTRRMIRSRSSAPSLPFAAASASRRRSDAATLPVVLGEAADGRERRPQFVTGVGDELPHPLLGPPCGLFRLRLGVERRLDLAEHALSERPRLPTSVCGSRSGTRRVRSPAAIAPAVASISFSGRRLPRMARRRRSSPSSTRTISPTIRSMVASWPVVR